jgi:NADPH:quinone reductase-like Zn-dependent oxidoreductase
MKAAWIDRFGGVDVIKHRDFPKPERKTGELLVKMVCATLNHRDVYVRRGESPNSVLPAVLGSDGAGHIVDCDADSQFEKGQAIAIYPVVSCGRCCSCRAGKFHKCKDFKMIGGEFSGTQAEYVAIPEACAVPIPQGLELTTAASISLAGLTAWNMVFDEGEALNGEYALVLGASGGVGSAIVALLKRLGAHVTAITANPDKSEFIYRLGADVVLADLDSPIHVLRAAKALENGGFDLAFNFVGGNSWRYVPLAIRPGGRILTCGSVRSPVAEIDMRQIFYKNIVLIGCSMGTPEALKKMLDAAVDDPALNVKIDSVISVDQVGEAHRKMESGQVFGKIVVEL